MFKICSFHHAFKTIPASRFVKMITLYRCKKSKLHLMNAVNIVSTEMRCHSLHLESLIDLHHLLIKKDLIL